MPTQSPATAAHHVPVDDLTYDVLTILHEKSKALEAYDKYLRDAAHDPSARELIAAIRDSDEGQVSKLKFTLARLLAHDIDATGTSSHGRLPRSMDDLDEDDEI